MKKIIIFLVCLISLNAYSESAQLSGKFSTDHDKKVLNIKLVNKTEHSICLQDWGYPETQSVIKNSSDEFIIYGESGRQVKYIGPDLTIVGSSKSHLYFILAPGEELSENIDLNESYDLSPGRYSLKYFKGVIDCAALNKGPVSLDSSAYLKFLYIKNNDDFDVMIEKLNGFGSDLWVKYGRLLQINSMNFSVPKVH